MTRKFHEYEIEIYILLIIAFFDKLNFVYRTFLYCTGIFSLINGQMKMSVLSGVADKDA